MSSTDAALSSPSNVPLKQLYKMKFQRPSTKMQETVQNVKDAVCRVRGSEDGVEKSWCGPVGSRKRNRLQRKRDCLDRDGVRLSPGEMVKATDTGRTGFSLETRHERILADPFRTETLQSLAERRRE